MGRNATLTIDNETTFELEWRASDITHGKFQKGHEPPGIIGANSTGTFSVGNKTGALIGPEGTVTYVATSQDETVAIVFYWNHPFGKPISAYEVWSEPEGGGGISDPACQPERAPAEH
jgi:hypothetical protein